VIVGEENMRRTGSQGAGREKPKTVWAKLTRREIGSKRLQIRKSEVERDSVEPLLGSQSEGLVKVEESRRGVTVV
jgi:hypothetical protein